MASFLLFAFYLFTELAFLSSGEVETEHPRCPPFSCGDHRLFKFPFTSVTDTSCGIFPINCSDYQAPTIQFKPGGHWYKVLLISQMNSVLINDTDLETQDFDLESCKSVERFSFPATSVFSNVSINNSSSLLKCSHGHPPHPPPLLLEKRVIRGCKDYDIYNLSRNSSLTEELRDCSAIELPVNASRSSNNRIVLRTQFWVDVRISRDCDECFNVRKGRCGSQSENEFTCLNEFRPNYSESTGNSRSSLVAIIATTCVVAGIALLFVVLKLKKITLSGVIFFWTKRNKAHQNIEAFLKHYGPLQLRRYSYSNVKKMTKSFKEKLGKGGFGDVYKGKLKDGRLVAVKMLNKKKGDDGEGFINEVATISRTSHINIVTLLGFCFEREKRALIYEFMPNGSLEKFVFGETITTEDSRHLNWEKHHQISLGIAKGLEYLHRGCNTRIVHFDIKPHNILLDVDFVPKISDFGLAKICTKKESAISMLIPRGTMGYIAPEVFSRNFGEVSHKSDVYSYGMMVLEMVGCRRNINAMAEKSSEIYFPHWIHRRVELGKDLGLKNIVNKDDESKVRNMILVSLWCIQADPSNRPTMNRVIEMLNGSLDSLPIPPKPLLSSPSRSSPPHFSELLNLSVN